MHTSTSPTRPVNTGASVPGAQAGSGAPGPLDTAHIPFIALTEGERRLSVPGLGARSDGWVAYQDPSPYDRYPDFHVLLTRTGGLPSGRPDGNQLSPYRQAHCMVNLLCQGCGAPAARSPEGWPLWVLPLTRADGGPAARTGISDMPPSCARCALHRCPVLKKRGRQLLWVAQAELVGVYATVFPPGTNRVMKEQLVSLNDERRLSAAVATRFVRDLQRVSPADLCTVEDLAQMAPRGRR